MVNKTKPLLLIILILLASNLALIFFFVLKDKPQVKYNSSRPDDQGGLYTTLKKDVGFDTVQIEQYMALRKQQFQNIRPLFGEMRKSKENFYSLLYQPEVSDSVKQERAKIIGEKQAMVDLNMFNYFASIRKLCKSDQLQKFDTAMNKSIQRMTGAGRDRDRSKSRH